MHFDKLWYGNEETMTTEETNKWAAYLDQRGWVETKAAMKVVGWSNEEIGEFARSINFYPDPPVSKDKDLAELNKFFGRKEK